MTSPIRVFVTGAGGFIGLHLIPALRRAGYDVICGSRNVESLRTRFPFCQVIECDFANPPANESWDSMFRGVSVVINAVGIIQEHGDDTFDAVHRVSPIRLFRAAEQAGVQRVIQISALGADAEAETRYHQTKQAADEALRALSLEWVILQPSLVYGAGGHSHAFFSALAALPVMPMPGPGDQQIQPVHVDDLVLGIMQLVQSDAPSHLTLAVVGPKPVTFRFFMETIRRWLGLTAGPTFSMPMGVVRLAARIGGLEFILPNFLFPYRSFLNDNLDPLQEFRGCGPRPNPRRRELSRSPKEGFSSLY